MVRSSFKDSEYLMKQDFQRDEIQGKGTGLLSVREISFHM